MFKIKSLSVKNFMSVGNATQGIDFDRRDLTLVLGENLDLGGDDSGARNGTGKTTIINALSYALFGQALTNIKKDNLINKTNAKNMLVTIDFDCDNQNYRIERGRKPNVLKFYVNNQELESKDDNSQGDSRETQAEIERMINMSHDMFKHIVALNTYTEPFLALKANEQRAIIEQLLGITLLSEKADALKEQNKLTKDSINQEEFRIKATTDANKRIQEQIDSLLRKQRNWLTKKEEDILGLQSAYDALSELNIEEELRAHKKLSDYVIQSRAIEKNTLALKRAEQDRDREIKQITKLESDIASLENHTCNTCGQSFHDQNHKRVLDEKRQQLNTSIEALNECCMIIDQLLVESSTLGVLGAKPSTFYETEGLAIEHKSSMSLIAAQLISKQQEVDPYAEQIHDMKSHALQEINYDQLNELARIKEHQDFLIKLLTNKDSFIRKRIIDQNLNYLNIRLSYYLDKIGLPHTVKFNNDLSVTIEELGRELDFDNLSRGERNRLILSLSWSFRDVWESLYQSINLLFIDELVDSGMDSHGVENALAILKKMSRESKRSIWLVSQKDELAVRFNNVLTVVKENGFTNYSTDINLQ